MKEQFERFKRGECTPELFLEMCKAHDLTYMHSDDHRVYKQGKIELALISSAVLKLGRSCATAWNSVVREKITNPETQKQFLWKEPSG